MAEMIKKLLTETPPSGWRWQLIGGGKTLKGGTASSKAEANAAAEKALDEFRKKPKA